MTNVCQTRHPTNLVLFFTLSDFGKKIFFSFAPTIFSAVRYRRLSVCTRTWYGLD